MIGIYIPFKKPDIGSALKNPTILYSFLAKNIFNAHKKHAEIEAIPGINTHNAKTPNAPYK